MFVKVFSAWVVLAAAVTASVPFQHEEGKVQRDDKTGLAGESVSLYCEVDREMCGNVHSMKWSKGFKRLFIYSEDPYVENAEGSFLGRTIFHYSNETKNSTLEVFPMRIEDEGEYSCEITFFNAHEGCAMVQYVNLTIQAIPSYPQLSFEDGSRVQNATTVGPFDEAEVLILNCESSGGKPVAQVTWYNGTHPIAGAWGRIKEKRTGVVSYAGVLCSLWISNVLFVVCEVRMCVCVCV
uniref:Ig-like domain-containing protein n=2 Tax=Scylla olivacea TaxID=85551 RepID=A0A0P4VXF3_SCYOL